MPIGAGNFAAGSYPAGFGVPETSPNGPAAPLPSAATGAALPGRFIDQTTKDYVMLGDGRLRGMPSVAQLVLLAIEGIDLSRLTEKGPNFKGVLSSLVTTALAPLVAQKLVRVRQVTVLEPTRDAGFAQVDWVDLTTGAPVQTTIGA